MDNVIKVDIRGFECELYCQQGRWSMKLGGYYNFNTTFEEAAKQGEKAAISMMEASIKRAFGSAKRRYRREQKAIEKGQ